MAGPGASGQAAAKIYCFPRSRPCHYCGSQRRSSRRVGQEETEGRWGSTRLQAGAREGLGVSVSDLASPGKATILQIPAYQSGRYIRCNRLLTIVGWVKAVQFGRSRRRRGRGGGLGSRRLSCNEALHQQEYF